MYPLSFLNDIKKSGKTEYWVMPRTVNNILQCINDNNEIRIHDFYNHSVFFVHYYR